jgi:hypothetical protein
VTFDHQTLKLLFGIAVRSDRLWRLRAVQLLRSASLILSDALAARDMFLQLPLRLDEQLSDDEVSLMACIQQYQVGFFLVALAAENLLKELWILQNEIGEVTHIKKDLGDHFSHDQVRIARACGLPLSSEEVELLTAFKDMTEWLGKYPVPLHINAYREHINKGSLSWLLFKAATEQDPWSLRVSALIEKIIRKCDDEKA